MRERSLPTLFSTSPFLNRLKNPTASPMEKSAGRTRSSLRDACKTERAYLDYACGSTAEDSKSE